MKVEIWFNYNRRERQWYCGIGDGVIDGLYATGKTKGDAAIAFIKEYNNDARLTMTGTGFTITSMPQ